MYLWSNKCNFVNKNIKNILATQKTFNVSVYIIVILSYAFFKHAYFLTDIISSCSLSENFSCSDTEQCLEAYCKNCAWIYVIVS